MAPTVRRTACTLDCPDACTLEVAVDDGRLVAVDAAPADDPADDTADDRADDPVNPFTAGFICAKVRRHGRRVHAPERILTPLRRVGPKGEGRFVPISWDDAVDLVADRLRATIAEHGPGAVAPSLYSSSAGRLSSGGLVPLVWEALGTAEVADDICAATAGAAWEVTFGAMPSAHPEALADSRLVVLWGANPAVSNTHLLPLLTAARRRGATVVVIDPRRTATARRADLHVPVRPGSDLALALGVAATLETEGRIDEHFVAAHVDGAGAHLAVARVWTPDRVAEACGIEADTVVDLARLIADERPGLLRVGWGLERHRRGGSAVRSALALWALAGQFGQSGAGVLGSTSDAPFWDEAPLRRAVLGEEPPPPRRQISMSRLGAVLAGSDPAEAPVHLLFVQGSNPAATAPNQSLVHRGLARDDLFTVVHEQVLTDTARFADVVLPATTSFEADDVAVAYGTFATQAVPAVIDRVGESRTNAEVAAALAVAMGLDPVAWDPAPARVLGLVASGGLPPVATRTADRAVQLRDTWPGHADGSRRIRLTAPTPVAADLDPTDGFPLALVSPASPRTINTMFGEWAAVDTRCHLHPSDAAERGLDDGDRVRVWNDLGALHTTVAVDPDLRPGVAAMAKGAWCRDGEDGWTVNVLVPDTASDLGAGACFSDARVEVARRP